VRNHIGIIAKDTLAAGLLEGLRWLEYLGYDWPVLQPWSTNSGCCGAAAGTGEDATRRLIRRGSGGTFSSWLI
jgi:hypothetical protein